jgi:hypothetical protein
MLIRVLKTVQKALSTEQSARPDAEKILQQSKDVNAALSLKLDNVETSLALTQTKLDRKSKALKIVKADLKAKGLLLESTQQALAKRDGSANMMISSAVAHTAALFKNHLPDLNVEILRQDFTVDDTGREALVSSVFDAAQEWIWMPLASYTPMILCMGSTLMRQLGFYCFSILEDRRSGAPCFLYAVLRV